MHPSLLDFTKLKNIIQHPVYAWRAAAEDVAVATKFREIAYGAGLVAEWAASCAVMCSYGLTPLESIGINSFVHYAAAKLLSSAVARTNAHAPDVDEAFFTGISSFGALCARLVTYEIGMKRQPKRCATRAGALAPRHG